MTVRRLVFLCYQRLGWWAMNRSGRVPFYTRRARIYRWLWHWTLKQRSGNYDREEAALVVIAALLVSFAIWWLVGMPGTW